MFAFSKAHGKRLLSCLKHSGPAGQEPCFCNSYRVEFSAKVVLQNSRDLYVWFPDQRKFHLETRMRRFAVVQIELLYLARRIVIRIPKPNVRLNLGRATPPRTPHSGSSINAPIHPRVNPQGAEIHPRDFSQYAGRRCQRTVTRRSSRPPIPDSGQGYPRGARSADTQPKTCRPSATAPSAVISP